MEPYALTIAEAAARIARRELSPVELVESVLARIEAVEPAISAFVTVTADHARRSATHAEREIAADGPRTPLHGIPVGLKDIIETAGIPTTASSAVLARHVPGADAVVVQRLAASGAVVVGKTHTHEFAMGGITPTTRNPWDTTRIPGGSSGGSAAAVASGECLAALGTDTVGSVRIPAALCGTVGLKATYGRVPRRGVLSLSWSLDHVGPLTRTVEDAALVLQEVAGHDPVEGASSTAPVPSYTAGLRLGVRGLRVGVPTDFFFDRVRDEVADAVRTAAAALADAGAVLREVPVPLADLLEATAHTLLLPEAAAYHRAWRQESAALYGPELLLRLQAGELVPATAYIDAQRTRALLVDAWKELFADVDVLVAPVVSAPAPRAGQAELEWPDGTTEPVSRSLARLALAANVVGVPALAVPCGHLRDGLPLSVQVIGRPFEEATVLRVGQAVEDLLGRDTRLPPLPARR